MIISLLLWLLCLKEQAGAQKGPEPGEATAHQAGCAPYAGG
jgi:hypothetical protein